MSAYRLNWKTPLPGYRFGKTTVSLPAMRCPSCRRVQAGHGKYHPSIPIEPLAQSELRKLKQIASLEKFKAIRKLLPDVEPIWDLPPGCEFGVQTIVLDEVPNDFFLHMTYCLISERALSALSQNRIVVYTGPVNLYCRKQKLVGWRAVDFPAIRLLSENSWKRFGFWECAVCGNILMKNIPDGTDIAFRGSTFEFVVEAWPKRLGLAWAHEIDFRVASPQFIKTWKHGGFTGLEFLKIGEWVKKRSNKSA